MRTNEEIAKEIVKKVGWSDEPRAICPIDHIFNSYDFQIRDAIQEALDSKDNSHEEEFSMVNRLLKEAHTKIAAYESFRVFDATKSRAVKDSDPVKEIDAVKVFQVITELREAVKKAPHDAYCSSRIESSGGLSGMDWSQHKFECDCFKKVLSSESRPKGEEA